MYRLGDYTVLPAQNCLEGPDGPVHLEPKVMAVLVQLMEHEGAPVSRDQLMATVWAGTIVGDEALTRCVSELRAAFSDSAHRPKYIQTIPKTGYQLVQPVERLKPAGGVAKPMVMWLAAAGIAAAVAAFVWLATPTRIAPSVAVLPFASLTEDTTTNHFGAGLAEEILHALINVDGLQVAGRHASFQVDAEQPIADIADQLAVDHLLTGTIRRLNSTIRVAVQLTDVKTGFHLWSESYEGDLTQLFEIQDEIASTVAEALQVKLNAPLSVARVTQNVDALDLYLLGRYHWNQRTPESLAKAVGFFKEALSIDPQSAHAHSGLADAHMLLASYGDLDTDSAISLAAPSVEAALAIDPELAASQASLGMLMLLRGDELSAEQAFLRSVNLDRHNDMAQMWLGNALSGQGRLGEAHERYARAFELRPTHPVIGKNFVNSAMMVGDYGRAREVLERFAGGSEANMMTELRAAYALDTRADELAVQTAGALEQRGESFAAAMIRWRLSRQQGDWAAAEQWLTVAASHDGPAEQIYLARLELAAITGAPEDQLEALIATHPEEKYRAWELAWLGISRAQRGDFAAASPLLRQSRTAPMGKKRHYMPFQLLVLSYIVVSCRATQDEACLSEALAEGNSIVADSRADGWGSVPFTMQEVLFHAVAGDESAALASLRRAAVHASLSPAVWERDPHTRLLRDQPIYDALLSQSRSLQRGRIGA